MKPFHTFHLYSVLATMVFVPRITTAVELDSFIVFGKESVTIGRDAMRPVATFASLMAGMGVSFERSDQSQKKPARKSQIDWL